MSDPHEVIVPLRPPFLDARGTIQNLVDVPLGSLAIITSRAGAARGNHYHKTDYHYTWLQSGRMTYLQRAVGSNDQPERFEIEAGQMFYTPPMVEHAMLFSEDSVMVVVARNPRNMDNYEADIVRINLVGP